jgi:hypothetical protein
MKDNYIVLYGSNNNSDSDMDTEILRFLRGHFGAPFAGCGECRTNDYICSDREAWKIFEGVVTEVDENEEWAIIKTSTYHDYDVLLGVFLKDVSIISAGDNPVNYSGLSSGDNVIVKYNGFLAEITPPIPGAPAAAMGVREIVIMSRIRCNELERD